MLGYGGFLLLGGRAADLLGRRRMFLISLGVFIVASALGGFVDDGSLLIATRFIKGVSAAFTAPAGLSIITTSFAEGPARNKALVDLHGDRRHGLLARPRHRRPADRDRLALGVLPARRRSRWPTLIARHPARAATPAASRARAGSFDLAGAVSDHGGMLLLVYTVVEAPDVGWASARTLGSFAGAAAILAALRRHRAAHASPLVRLGILRSGSLVRANLGAMALFGAGSASSSSRRSTCSRLRGWSALETGLAIFPAGLLVARRSRRASRRSSAASASPRLIVAGLRLDRSPPTPCSCPSASTRAT